MLKYSIDNIDSIDGIDSIKKIFSISFSKKSYLFNTLKKIFNLYIGYIKSIKYKYLNFLIYCSENIFWKAINSY